MGEGRRAGALRALLRLLVILGWLNLTKTLTGTIFRLRGVFSFDLTCLYSIFHVFHAFFLFSLYFVFFNIQSIDSANGLAF